MYGDNKWVKWFWWVFGTFTIVSMVAALFVGIGL